MTPFDELPAARFQGLGGTDPLNWRWYDPQRVVAGKTMAEHLRWSVAYWHSFAWPGSDVFGPGIFERPWHPGQPVTPERALSKMDAAFAFFAKAGAPYFCFHDVDAMPDADTAADYTRQLEWTVGQLHDHMARSSVRLLWGTANLFGHPRYMAGAATNPDPDVFLWAAHQVRSMLDATHALGGANYVLWGGREGYETLLNTDLARERAQLGRFLAMVADHKHRVGFAGTLLLEPKPHEPTKHQYDRDVATVHGFLKSFALEGEYRLNVEANHATLAGFSFEHEVAQAAALGMLGSIDINRGDPQNGWDTDQFPHDNREIALVMFHVLKAGGIGSGGFNFDAKVRRQSIDPMDLLQAHVGGVDMLARGLLAADAVIRGGELDRFVAERYAGWDDPLGQELLAGKLSLADAGARAGDPKPRSGRQEYLETVLNRYV